MNIVRRHLRVLYSGAHYINFLMTALKNQNAHIIALSKCPITAYKFQLEIFLLSSILLIWLSSSKVFLYTMNPSFFKIRLYPPSLSHFE